MIRQDSDHTCGWVFLIFGYIKPSQALTVTFPPSLLETKSEGECLPSFDKTTGYA